MLRLGTIALGKAPAVAVAIQDAVEPDEIVSKCPAAIVEMRLDALGAADTATLNAFASQYRAFPRLATIRSAEEGGAWRGSEEERLECYRGVLSETDAVDIEIKSGTITRDVVEAAHKARKLVIGSFHDFTTTPSDESLDEVFHTGRDQGVDIVKVAAKCNSPEDSMRLAAFTLARQRDNVIVVGMGPHGKASRVFFPALGSLITYTFLGEPTAPGQLNCADTVKYLSDFYPQGLATPE